MSEESLINGERLKEDIRNDEDIARVVHTFYDKVQKDDRLGYIFNDFARVEWETHLPRMVDFWSNILFRTGRYQGRPFRHHLPLPVVRDDFGRWYRLFVETVDELYSGQVAEEAKRMAGRIAAAFAIRMEQEGKFGSSSTGSDQGGNR